MRSMIDNGIVLRSTDEPTPEAEDPLIQRTPSTSTSTRLEPRWRRSTVAAPAPTPPPSGGQPQLPLALNLVFSAAPLAVRFGPMSATEGQPRRSMSSRVGPCPGPGLLTPAVFLRGP